MFFRDVLFGVTSTVNEEAHIPKSISSFQDITVKQANIIDTRISNQTQKGIFSGAIVQKAPKILLIFSELKSFLHPQGGFLHGNIAWKKHVGPGYGELAFTEPSPLINFKGTFTTSNAFLVSYSI